MSLNEFYIRTQIEFLGLQLALAGEVPKRSGDFETIYKTESGKEVTVKRSPDGKFAHKNESAGNPENTIILDVDREIVKSFAKTNDELANLPAKMQAQLNKLIFDSDFSEGIHKVTKSIVDKIGDPNLTTGFNLGQRINDELAKKPFSEFGQAIVDKFAEFRKALPQKTDDLKKEIVRIAQDPNTSATLAVGTLMALAGYFHIAGAVAFWRAGAAAFQGLKILPAVAAGVISPAQAIAEQTLVNALIGANIGAAFCRNVIAAVLASQAGRITLDRVKANATAENDRLKQEIFAKKENSDALYQQQLEQQTKDAETRKKILEEVSKEIPKKQEDLNPDKLEALAGVPVIDVRLTDVEEAFASDPKRREQILATAYKDEEFLKLSFAYMEAQALALVASFSDKAVEKQFIDIMEQAKKAINDRLTVVIKAEIKRLQAIEAQ